MYTREEFERKRAAGNQIERDDMRLLAIVSVGLGVAQLILIRWLRTRIDHRSAVTIEGAVFLAYIGLVCWLAWRMQRRLRAARLTCPQCGVVLQAMSARIAAATGRCDSCGGRVVEEIR